MEITHDTARQRFVLPMDDGGEAVLEYRDDGGCLDFLHTYVPAKWRGRGFAERVVRAGFDFARANSLKIIPTCPYIETFLRRHPEERDLVEDFGG